MIGADLVFPQQFLQAAPITRIIDETKPTLTGAVPTVLNDLLHNAPDTDMSSFRLVMCGGSAVPRGLIDGYRDTFGVPIVQGWGMTETSPVCAIGHPPKDMGDLSETDWRVKTGRIMPGVELRITDDNGERAAVGRRGARRDRSARLVDHRRATTTSTIPRSSTTAGCAPATSPACMPNGYVMISDRAKDVIKSGGEWVSSVDLENTLMGHPAILEAAVIGVPDDRWDERPLACVVLKPERVAHRRGAAQLAHRAHRQVLVARAVGVHHRGAQDQRRQVRQEGPRAPANDEAGELEVEKLA